MPIRRNLTKLFSHEGIEYGIGLMLAYYGLLNVEGFILFMVAMQFIHLADFETIDKLATRLKGLM